jgi:hypothetical protein
MTLRVGRTGDDNRSERAIQREIVRGLRKLGYIVAAVPNGVRYSGSALGRAKQAAALKADGVVPGWPDIIACRAGRCGFIEVKRAGGYASDAQQAVGRELAQAGLPVAFVCSLEQAVAAVESWGW